MRTQPTRYLSFFFFFNDTATTEIYTLSLHDALPITLAVLDHDAGAGVRHAFFTRQGDRKSTRLNSSHVRISYAVFCLKKKNIHRNEACNVHKTLTILVDAPPTRRQ